jgi:hypothetical protein
MKVPVPHTQISADKQSLSFTLIYRGESVLCVVSRAALEIYFWLPPGADDAQLLTVFSGGFPRIEAVARRKLLAHPTSRLRLTDADFGQAKK